MKTLFDFWNLKFEKKNQISKKVQCKRTFKQVIFAIHIFFLKLFV